MSQVVQIPIKLLDDHPGNSIYEINDENVKELAGSIKLYGVLEPLKIKPSGERFLVISGHRRKRASILVGLETLPCIIAEDDVNDEEILIEHNRTSREKSIMEKAREIRRIKELRGERRGRKKAEEKNGNGCRFLEELGISERTFRLYDKLNDLIPELQCLIDAGALGLRAGERLASLDAEAQKELFEFLGESICDITPGEVRKLREQNDMGYMVLETLQDKLNECQAELQERRAKDGDISELNRHISALRSKKQTAEHDLADIENAVSQVRERTLRNGSALLYLIEELARPVAGAKPKIELLLENPMDTPTAANVLKWAQALTEIGRMVELAAKKVLITINKTEAK